MDRVLYGAALLAQHRVHDMGRRFRAGSSHVEARDFLTLATILISAVLAIWLLSRLTAKRENLNSPRALFAQLCRAHGLDGASRRLLQRLARAQELSHPARLFLEPERFDRVHLHPNLAGAAQQLETLRDRLFSRRMQ